MFQVIEPGLLEILNAFFNTNAGPEGLADLINTKVIPAAKRLWDFIKDNILPKLKEWFDRTADLITQAGGFDGILKAVDAFVGGFQKAMLTLQIILLPATLAAKALVDTLKQLGVIKVPSVGGGGSAKGNTFMASGGILDKATMIAPRTVAGEAGREALVPLDQPLWNVDPSVRDLAAFAKFGGTLGGDNSKHLSVAPGAIVVQDSGDGETTAEAVMDRIAAEAAA